MGHPFFRVIYIAEKRVRLRRRYGMANDSDRLEEILNEIITDRRYIIAANSAGNERVLAIRTSLPAEKHYARHVYRQELKRAKLNGLPSEHEMLESASLRGDWDADNDKLIALYTKKISQLESLIDPRSGLFRHNKGKAHKLRLDIIKTRKELNKLQIQRDDLLVMTAEYHARNYEFVYLFSRMVMDENDAQLWATWNDYKDERDNVLVSSIIFKYKHLKSAKESDFRALVRSSGWSIIWNSAKKTATNIFSRPPSDYTRDQLSVLFWSMMYDSVYESMDRPSDEIVEDDDKLDKWFEEQKEERQKTTKKKQLDKRSTSRHPEQFIMVGNEQEADDIYNLNDKVTLARIQREIKAVSDSKQEYVDEVQLKQGQIRKQALTERSTINARKSGMQNQSRRFLG